jgi:GNAT superfamily N-acetyltransferase
LRRRAFRGTRSPWFASALIAAGAAWAPLYWPQRQNRPERWMPPRSGAAFGPTTPRSLSFVSRRGFEQIGREVELVRPVGPNEGEIPAGVVELGPEHRRDAYDVAVECVGDIPRAGKRGEARPYGEWVADELAGPVAFAALDADRVVGYAVLFDQPAVPHRLEHGLTAVLRSHRGRGIATALQQAEIAWASAHGYRELVTTTHELNAPMRAVKPKLGYVERATTVEVRGEVL